MSSYRLEPPFSISFSGGESSGFMLHQILDEFGGSLPAGAVVLFANTGLEHEKTLEFVRNAGDAWGVSVRWLEYDAGEVKETTFEDASRAGEPFESLISERGYLPTPVARICTVNLKVRLMAKYLKGLGWTEWEAAVGLRADEPHRAARIKGDCAAETTVCPMAEAGHTLEDVEAFWSDQAFRLEIPRWLGNCQGCFLKSRGRIELVAEQYPEALEWWDQTEQATGKRFRIDRPSYGNILQQVSIQGRLFEDDGTSAPCRCSE